MNVFLKLLKADPERKSRMHDLRGNFIGARALVACPYWIWNWTRAKLGAYPRLPWIPPSARRRLSEIAGSDWTVLECGSGMSSLWWASKVQRVISLETNAAWHEKLKATADAERIQNLELHHVQDYQSLLMQKLPEADLLVIDGDVRDVCARILVNAVKRPTWIYLDNSDFAAIQTEMREAEQTLLGLGEKILTKEYFLGMPPGQLAPTQGLLLRLK